METRYRFLSGHIIELKKSLHQADSNYRATKDLHTKGGVGSSAVKEAYEAFFGCKQALEKAQSEFFSVQSAIFS